MTKQQVFDLIEQYKKKIDCSENSGYMDDFKNWVEDELDEIEENDHLQDRADAEYRDFCNDK
jgi:hypothetical protein